MEDRMIAVDSSSGSSYDLRPFAAQDRRLNAYAARVWWYMGLGFSGFGIAITLYLGISFGFDPWISTFLLVLFSGVGFGPLLLTQVPDRGWRARVELRLEDRGIALIDSAGRAERLGWNDPAAVVTVREITSSGPSGKTAESGEWMIMMPGSHTAHIGADAREGLIAACRAHGFVLGEDSFDVPNPGDHGRTSATAILRMAALPPPGGAFGSSISQPSDRLHSATSTLPGAGATFTAPSEEQDLGSGTPATKSNPIAEVTVTPEGMNVVFRDSRTVAVDWRVPKLRLQLFTILPNPVSALSDALSWRVSVRRPSVEGSISPEAYAAVTASARAAGMMTTTIRVPRPDLGRAAAITTIRKAVPLP